MVHRTFFVAEIQRQIVLKFQIFRIISFEDIIVGSWSGLKLKKVKMTKNLNFFDSDFNTTVNTYQIWATEKYFLPTRKLSAIIIIIMPTGALARR